MNRPIRIFALLLLIAALIVPVLAQDTATPEPTEEATGTPADTTVTPDMSPTAEATLIPTIEVTVDATLEATATAEMAATQVPTQEPAQTATPTFMINAPDVVATDSVAFVAFAHASIDAGPVDFYIEGMGTTPVVANLAFGEATSIFAVPAGTHTMTVRGAGSGADSEPVVSTSWDFTGNSTWIIAAVGLASTSSVQAEPVTVIRTPLDGMSRVRIVNWVADVVPLNVVSDSADTPDFAANIGWAGVQDSEVEPGSYTLQITGEDDANIGESHTFDFEADMVYTIMLIGSTGGSPAVEFLVVQLPQDETRVRFVNERAEAIDVHGSSDGSLAAGNVAAGGTSDWFTVPSTAETFVAFAPGTGPSGQELAAFPIQLRPWRDVTIVFRADGTVEVQDEAMTPDFADAGSDSGDDMGDDDTDTDSSDSDNDNDDSNG